MMHASKLATQAIEINHFCLYPVELIGTNRRNDTISGGGGWSVLAPSSSLACQKDLVWLKQRNPENSLQQLTHLKKVAHLVSTTDSEGEEDTLPNNRIDCSNHDGPVFSKQPIDPVGAGSNCLRRVASRPRGAGISHRSCRVQPSTVFFDTK